MSKKVDVKIYTDGACKGNPGIGGWGALLICEKGEKELFGGELYTTNNQMELKATIMALRALKRPCNVELWTDSQYVKRGMTEWVSGWIRNNWKNSSKKDVKNADLWKELVLESNKHEVNWNWVKGHNGHDENERADGLANKGINSLVD